MAQFQEDIRREREKARNEMDGIPNPFVNAKKGSPYHISIEMPRWIRKFRFFGLSEAGLAWDVDEENPYIAHISGIPREHGEYPIKLCYIHPSWGSGQGLLVREFRLNVLPDPREMWKDIPSDQTEEYARPDLECEFMECGSCDLIGASRRGRSHAHTGKPRDDAFGMACLGPWQALVVADGAGSAEFSRRGSQLACETALAQCAARLGQAEELDGIFAAAAACKEGWLGQAKKSAYGILAGAAFEASKAIRREAETKGREARLYATTFLLALSRKYPEGWAVISFQVGDGAMAMFCDGTPYLLAEPDEGEYGGQTRFITMNEIFEPQELMRRIRVDFVHGLEELILMTDGISDSRFVTLEGLMDKSLWTNFRNELGGPLGDNEPEKALLEWLNFWSRGNHDDRTIAIMRAGR